MTGHFPLLLLFALLVSIVGGTLHRDEPRAQLRTGAIMFATLVFVAFALGWLMYPLPL